MVAATHLSFTLAREHVRDRILIPKFYDPELVSANRRADENFRLAPLADLLLPGNEGSRLGTWVEREKYGSGSIPYVRTSDLAQWRIRADFKKGVSEAVYEDYRDLQDIAAGDLLMVAHGTYLVGTVALVAPGEQKLVLQDHVFRLRVRSDAPVDSFFLLAALSTQFVRRQIRVRQFSADIIDKIGDRHLSIEVPIPRDEALIRKVSDQVRTIIALQTQTRSQIVAAIGSQLRMTTPRAEARHCFTVSRSTVRHRVLIPKYYDPALEEEIRKAEADDGTKWVTINKLMEAGRLLLETGVEVGKMAYGTGDIPFIRTSDISDLEVKADFRHGISEAILIKFNRKAALQPRDILLVRDGTYLVGSTAIVTEEDCPALFCGGIYRLRLRTGSSATPFALLAGLNLAAVRKALRSKQFTRDVIDTLGDRVREVRVPDPFSPRWQAIGERIGLLFGNKTKIRRTIGEVLAHLEPPAPPTLTGRPSWSMR